MQTASTGGRLLRIYKVTERNRVRCNAAFWAGTSLLAPHPSCKAHVSHVSHSFQTTPLPNKTHTNTKYQDPPVGVSNELPHTTYRLSLGTP